MQIPILIEPIEGDRYRARAGEPFAVSVEGATKLQAYQKLQALIFDRIRAGAELMTLEVPLVHPLSVCAGAMKNDPFFDEFLAAIADNRRREDSENPCAGFEGSRSSRPRPTS
jgi:hypothetical protein